MEDTQRLGVTVIDHLTVEDFSTLVLFLFLQFLFINNDVNYL
jgi:hypothetical protein